MTTYYGIFIWIVEDYILVMQYNIGSVVKRRLNIRGLANQFGICICNYKNIFKGWRLQRNKFEEGTEIGLGYGREELNGEVE